MVHPTMRPKARRASLPGNQGSNPQRIWDACLLLAFRNRATLQAAVDMFAETTGRPMNDPSLRLSRIPLVSMMDQLDVVSTEWFLRQYLPTIYERAFKTDPANDVILLDKIQAWNHQTRQSEKPNVKIAKYEPRN